MMIGLGTLVDQRPGDMCVDMSTQQEVPCDPSNDNILCLDPNSGQHGKCSQLYGTGVQVPVLTLGDLLQRCPTYGCQIASATPPTFPGGGGGLTAGTMCDPMIMAGGYACEASQGYGVYTRTNQNPATSPNQLGLTPAQTSYLLQTGIINLGPTPTMNTPILSVYAPPIPTSGPAAPQQVLTSYVNSGVPQAAQLPATPAYNIPAAPMTAAPTGPDTVSLGIQPGVVGGPNPPAGTIPGSNTAAGAPAPAAPVTDTSGDILPGIPNNYLYIGGAVLLALLVFKK